MVSWLVLEGMTPKVHDARKFKYFKITNKKIRASNLKYNKRSFEIAHPLSIHVFKCDSIFEYKCRFDLIGKIKTIT